MITLLGCGLSGSASAQSPPEEVKPTATLPLPFLREVPTVPSDLYLGEPDPPATDASGLLKSEPIRPQDLMPSDLPTTDATVPPEREAITPGVIQPAPNIEHLPLPRVSEEFSFSPSQSILEQPIEPGGQAAGSGPWWHPDVVRGGGSSALRVELEELVWLAVAHSPTIQALLVEPQILDSRAAQKLGEFDPSNFVDSVFKDTSEPVGNTLTTGGPPRLNDDLWENRAGLRGRNQYGGQTEAFQELFFKDSNSLFFSPNDQANTKMVLRYTQPLMRGRGTEYNCSSFVVATIAANVSKHQASYALQEHIMRLTTAYWDIYASSATNIQNRRGIEKLQRLRDQLAGRQELDSLKSQILRAEAAIHRQNASLAQAIAQQQAAEANLKAAVASPTLRQSTARIVPTTPILNEPPQIEIEDERTKALQNHPKILEASESIKSVRTQLRVAEHELKPTLNLVLEGYTRGLNSNYDAIRSFSDQFSTTPSYHAGVAYQRPYNNTLAKMILRERRLELRRALLRLDETLLNVSAEVESAVAAVQSAYQQLVAAARSTRASEVEIEFLETKWNNAFIADARSSSLQLDQLLNAHIQLIASQNNWVQTERDYMLAVARLQLATGSLLPAIF